MSIKSIVQLLAQADSSFPDNTTQLITPAALRTFVKDFLDSISPAYGGILLTTLSKALTTTPSALSPWGSSYVNTTGYYRTSVANGEVIRDVATAGITGATDLVIFNIDVEGPNGNLVTAEIYKNGVSTGYRSSVTTNGAGKPESINLVGIGYTATVDVDWQVYVYGDAGNYTFTNGSLLAQAQPVRSYV
jgi:hypothetical protein